MKSWMTLGAVMLLGACSSVSAGPQGAEPRVLPPSTQGPPQGAYTRPSPGMGSQVQPGNQTGTQPGARRQPPDLRGGDTCGAGQFRNLVGRPLPQPFPANGPVRIFTTGQPVTMDHNPARLNVEVDASSLRRIVAVTCG